MKKLISIVFLILNIAVFAQQKSRNIKVDQLGYLPQSQKIAIVPGKGKGEFQLHQAKTGKVVYTSNLTKAKKWKYANEFVSIADFSSFQKEGSYYISASNSEVQKSFTFEINKNVYQSLAQASWKAFYLARVSTPIEEKYAGKYARPAGHPDDQVIVHKSAASKERPEGTVISSPGGWYDAGDYNKYIINSGITTFTLLHLVDLYPEFVKNYTLNIPENKNEIPDIIDEILWNLKWMVSMQDPFDGGVYHKLTGKNFSAHVMPHLAVNPRYVVQKSTPAALNLASVCAKASRVLRPWNEELNGYADSCLVVAKKAYEWAQKNPNIYFKQPKDISTGEYGDVRLADEFAWASVEMFQATNDDSYLEKELDKVFIYNVPSWPKTGTLGVYDILLNPQMESKKINRLAIYKGFMLEADSLLNRYEKAAYRVSLSRFEWGSNGHALNEAMVLLTAYKITDQKKYLDASEAILHYVNGLNPLNICYVTGFGSKSPMHIHDRRSDSDGIPDPIPGYIVGGPNDNSGEDCGKNAYKYKEPAIRYLDKECSYSTNEIAINWSAPFTFVLAAIQIEYKKLNKN